MRGGLVAAVLLAGLACVAPVAAQQPSLRDSLDLARAVAGDGRAARDPLALIVAARLRRDLAMTRRDDAAPRGAPSAADLARLDAPQTLVAEAKRLARGRSAIVALADEILATGEKGRERGPLYDIGKLAAGGREAYDNMRFVAGRRAEVYVEGVLKLALVVRDADGRTICADDAGGPVAYCWWTQARDGAVRIELLNRAGVDNAYRMVTN